MKLTGLFALAMLLATQSAPASTIEISKLSPPTYPPLARQARIAGTVELNVALRPDGSVDSVSLISGHPMLSPAAVESARQTRFKCTECLEPLALYHMTYKFELGEMPSCEGVDGNDSSHDRDTHVTQSLGIITIVGRPQLICDPAVKITFQRFRAAKCLYLWQCGRRELQRELQY